MVYLQYKDGSLIASTAYPKNMEDYRELTEEEYIALMEQAAEEEDATEEDYLAALEVLGVSE